MKNESVLFLCLSVAICIAFLIPGNQQVSDKEEAPNDWFFRQRAYPYSEINYAARTAAWQQSQLFRKANAIRGEGWLFEGPLNIGGRISAIAMPASSVTTIYAGAASGGIFKTTDAGVNWEPIFDDEVSLSIGDIAIAPSNEDVLYVGTGEANAGGGSMTYDGYGVYRSDNAGATWQHIGLEDCGSVGRIAVRPDNPQVCFVAAMGHLFSNNSERGVFRTTDGGQTWENVLFLNDSTGAIDVVIQPAHPDTLYACMWERVRHPDRRTYGGPSSGIYRSYNGGDTWTELTSGLPNDDFVGRIGIDIAASSPNTLYAIYADDIGYFSGVFKSSNGGDTWTETNDASLSNMYSSYGWWFGRIAVDPSDPNIAYAIGFDLYKTSNGGNSWSLISSAVHVDQHDIVIHPQITTELILGNDGGVYASLNGGVTWTFAENLPITQFYTCEVDEQYPERFYGGTQDNGTNRTLTGNDNDWESIYWGDGFYVLVDPTNNNYIYAEYQYGNFARSTNGGYGFSSAMTGIDLNDRMNWNTPFIIDPTNPLVLYFGTHRLYRSVNRAAYWTAISPDLTNGGGGENVVWGTITTIAAAPSNNQWVYVGTDDGNVWRTSNGGTNWANITAGLPTRWITRVAVDPYDENTVYVTLSGYRYDSYLPHVFRSTNGGQNWQDISGDLPEAPVNDIIVDPLVDSALYAATDFGVFVSWNLGQNWQMLGDNLPNVPVVDLRMHNPTHTLVAATYGRSMYSFNLDQLVGIHDQGIKGHHEITVQCPNPYRKGQPVIVSGEFQMDYTLKLYDPAGHMVYSKPVTSGRQFSIDQDLASGLYVLSVTEGGKALISKKILIIQ